MNFHNKQFRSVSNTANGEVSEQTLFHYRQKDEMIWATYQGGAVKFGTLCGKINPDFSLEFSYQHLNIQGVMMTGNCRSTPEILPNGCIRLNERWQWTCGDYSVGESIVEEIEAVE